MEITQKYTMKMYNVKCGRLFQQFYSANCDKEQFLANIKNFNSQFIPPSWLINNLY